MNSVWSDGRVQWEDGDPNRKTDRLTSKICSEWRFVLEGEDISVELQRLNGGDSELE